MPRTTSAGARISCSSRSEEHTSELQSQSNLVCRLLLEKKKKQNHTVLRLVSLVSVGHDYQAIDLLPAQHDRAVPVSYPPRSAYCTNHVHDPGQRRCATA